MLAIMVDILRLPKILVMDDVLLQTKEKWLAMQKENIFYYAVNNSSMIFHINFRR